MMNFTPPILLKVTVVILIEYILGTSLVVIEIYGRLIPAYTIGFNDKNDVSWFIDGYYCR